MRLPSIVRAGLFLALLSCLAVPAYAQTVRVSGVVRDEANAITLPGVPIEVNDTKQTVYTDVDGRYVVDLPPGEHDMTIAMAGYQPKVIRFATGSQRNLIVNVSLETTQFSETLTVTASAIDVPTSTAEAQLIQRMNAQVITDNLGSQEMKQNGDSDAAAAMGRVTGLSIVDNQFVFVRGLGERYSNTTLAGSVLPTTEPDKKVVPLDLFPSGLIDSVQVAKSYTPDKSSEFAGGLVQIIPLRFPTGPTLDFSYGYSHYSTATGKSIPLSPFGNKDWAGFDSGARALPDGFPTDKLVRRGLFTPEVGHTDAELASFGKLLAGGPWRPVNADGKPGQNWGTVFGNRFGKLGIVASVSQSYKEQAVDERRQFFHVIEGSGSDATLEAISDYQMQYGTQKAQLGAVANLAYQFSTNHRLNFENFYTHSGRDEGRTFEGYNLDNNRQYRNYRLQFIEEKLFNNAVGGEHFVQGLSNSRVEWRLSSARANRDEPRLREALYEYIPPAAGAATPPFTLSDESQAGFQMFNTLDDKTWDGSLNWSVFRTSGRPTQFKFGFGYIDRTRDFVSRRFRFIPITTQKADAGNILFNNLLTPEELYTPENVGFAFRFNEETRATDAYDGNQTTTSGYGMADISLTDASRLVFGARVERFDQEVNTLDPFGLTEASFAAGLLAPTGLQAKIVNTDVFPSVNFVRALTSKSNLRMSYSTTVNRPEFRELAAFEFTDVIGNRAVRGNPDLKRALIQNVDGRWEMFGGGRSVVATSVFYKYFAQPIETVILAAAQPISTFQNADNARNFGIELEAAKELGPHFFVNANYTFVDSTVSLTEDQTTSQTSLNRALVGQSKNLFNLMAETMVGGFSARLLVNYAGDRISEAGANDAPDIIEQGRGIVDAVFSQRFRGLVLRLNLENLTDAKYFFTQEGAVAEEQRLFKVGRTVSFSLSYSVF